MILIPDLFTRAGIFQSFAGVLRERLVGNRVNWNATGEPGVQPEVFHHERVYRLAFRPLIAVSLVGKMRVFHVGRFTEKPVDVPNVGKFDLSGTTSMSTAHSRRNIAAFNQPRFVCSNCNRSALCDSMLPFAMAGHRTAINLD